MSATVYLGTSSWLFDAWRGVFYPEKLPKTQYLSYYTTQFPTVEVNTSFYALPAPATLVAWVESAPAGFTFALKFPRAISHDKRLTDCTTETLAFLDALRALGAAAGPAFLQLPPDFSRRVYGRALAAYLDWVAPQLAGLRVAVEVRSADLMTPAFARFLAERGLALALVDRAGTIDLFDGWIELVNEGVGPDFAFLRWIGDDRNGPQGDRELQLNRDEELAAGPNASLPCRPQAKPSMGICTTPTKVTRPPACGGCRTCWRRGSRCHRGRQQWRPSSNSCPCYKSDVTSRVLPSMLARRSGPRRARKAPLTPQLTPCTLRPSHDPHSETPSAQTHAARSRAVAAARAGAVPALVRAAAAHLLSP